MSCPSLPMILKFSTDVLWPVMLSCSYIGDGAFKCPFNLSSEVLADTPTYSSSHSVLPHLYQYIILLCFFILSLSFGNINKFFNVFPPWSMPGLHTCYRWTCSFHIVLWYSVPLCDIFSVFWCFFLCSSCFFFCSCSLCIFWIAHLGYLHCVRTSSRCFSSSFSS